jgi:hypothetical protein
VCLFDLGSKGDRTKDMIQQITAGQIYKSLSDNDWGIKVIEIEPHGKKALVEYVSCGCPADIPKLGQRRVFLTEYIEKNFPIEYRPEPN